MTVKELVRGAIPPGHRMEFEVFPDQVVVRLTNMDTRQGRALAVTPEVVDQAVIDVMDHTIAQLLEKRP